MDKGDEVMDDLVSRETVRETLQMYIPGFKWDTIDKIVDMMPSAQPERTRFADKDHVWINGKQYISLQRFQKAVKEAQPEIIRCKDCEHWDTTWQNDWVKNYHYCPITDGTHRGGWYCADAERRTDG